MGFTWFLPGLWQTPALLVLEHVHNGQNIDWTIPAQSGQYTAPVSGLTVSGWTIAPGATVSGPEPPNRIVRFLVAGRVKPKLLCLVDVRYFALGNRWQPYYRMDEEMFFTHKGGRWMPLTLMDGVPALVTYTPIGFANPAGYYRGLSFSQTTGPITLIGWNVEREQTTPFPAP
ncbi:MAG: hypothetical protein ACYDEV_03290 [Acidiferrobacter sp.]